jgi:two-component sensor histidine kinase
MRIEQQNFRSRIKFLALFSVTCICNCYAVVLNPDTTQINILLKQAEKWVETNPEKADSLADISLKLSGSTAYKPGIAKSKYVLASVQRIANHNIPAIQNYFSCLEYYQTEHDSLKVQEIYQWLGLCLAFESYYDSGRKFIEKSITIADKLNLPGSLAQSYLNLARVHKSQGLLKLAIDDCKNALSFCNSSSGSEIRWKTENFLGYIYMLNNKQKEAAQLINRNMLSYKNYLEFPVEVCRLIYYSSLIDMYLNNYQKILQNQKTSLKIASTISNKNLSQYFIAMSQEFIGKAYIKLQQYDSAKTYFQLAFKNPEYTLDLHAKGEILANLGDAYFFQKVNDSALYYFKESVAVQTGNKNPMYLSWSLLGLGKTYYQMQESKLAEKYLLQANNVDNLNKNVEVVSQASELLSKIYLNRQDYKNAYIYQKSFKEASDELINRDKIRQLTQIELENEFEDREQQIQFERQQEKSTFELKLKQNKLIGYFTASGLVMVTIMLLVILVGYVQKRKANFEKEILLKEIHHRVKNNLQIISSMLSLQGNYLSDNKIKEAVMESQGRVKSMALIHQMLYQHENFSSIDIKDYIGQLVKNIADSFGPISDKITTTLDIEEVSLDIDTAIPLGLIVNELLTNVYKYAFPNGKEGVVKVNLKRLNEDKFELNVTDNGIGLPENIQNAKQRKTLGLNMVNILTRQLKGELMVSVNQGTKISLQFSEVIKHQN